MDNFSSRPADCHRSVANMQIRLATVEDAKLICDFVTRITQQHIAPTLSEAGLKHLIAGMSTLNQLERIRNGYRFFIAYDRNEILGVAGVKLPSHLYYLFVHPERQRQGIGRELWSCARESICETLKERAITVNSSLNAIGAYKRLGFSIDGPVQESHGVRFQPMRMEFTTEPSDATERRSRAF